MRWCWNWQTGMVEGHVPQGVRVQLPPSAPEYRAVISTDGPAYFNPLRLIWHVVGDSRSFLELHPLLEHTHNR
jgi:hypothetical protein